MKAVSVWMSFLGVVSLLGGARAQGQITATAAASVVVQTVSIPNSKTEAQIDWTNQRIEVTSYGLPKAGIDHPGQKRLTAREAALAIAYRDIAAVVAGVQVNSVVTVQDCMLQSATIRTEINAFIKGARPVKEEWNKDDEIYTVVMVMVLGLAAEEGASIQSIVAPELPKVQEQLRQEQPQRFEEPKPEVPAQPVAPPEAIPARKPGPYTGLIIDLRSYEARPCMSPKVVRQDGSEVWGTMKTVGQEFTNSTGIVGWLPDLRFSLKHERAGANPLIIRAIGVQGNYKANAVVSDADANLIRQANQESAERFLENCRVIFVVESPYKLRDMRDAAARGEL